MAPFFPVDREPEAPAEPDRVERARSSALERRLAAAVAGLGVIGAVAAMIARLAS